MIKALIFTRSYATFECAFECNKINREKGDIMKHITCTKCEETFPATDEYFRRNRRASSGFQSRCKECAQTSIKEHYVPFTELQLERRGEVGVKCPLYAKKCSKCIVLADCWRLDDIKFESESMPLKLKPLKKSRFGKEFSQIRQRNSDKDKE